MWKKIVWTDETQVNFYQPDGKRNIRKRKGRAHYLSNTVEAVMSWECMAANGTASLVVTDDVTADRGSRTNFEV